MGARCYHSRVSSLATHGRARLSSVAVERPFGVGLALERRAGVAATPGAPDPAVSVSLNVSTYQFGVSKHLGVVHPLNMLLMFLRRIVN